MAINIRIVGPQDTPEYNSALSLKEIFVQSIPQENNGEILIISNATLFGQETKDVDLIVIGYFEKGKNLRLKLVSCQLYNDG